MKTMIKTAIGICACLSLLISGAASSVLEPVESRSVTLTEKGENRFLPGESGVIQVEAQCDVESVACEIEGDAIRLAESGGDPCQGYYFKLEAVKPGKAAAVIKIVRTQKKFFKKDTARYEALVIDPAELPRVTLAQIHANPRDYAGRLIVLTGMNRGWGVPQKAHEVWGEHMTKSDWVLEDETGAVNITGIIYIKNGPITLVATVGGGQKWHIEARQILVDTTKEEDNAVPEKFIDLEPDKVNELKVGEIGRIVLNLSRSDVASFQVEGDALEQMKVLSLDNYYRAVKEGDVVIKIYITFFLDDHTIDENEPPTLTYRIKVTKP